MTINDVVTLSNIFACTVTALVLMFYRRGDSRHRPWISWLAYLAVLVYASVPFRFAFDISHEPHWLIVVVNMLICAAVLWVRGNIARLVDMRRYK